jgi:hypothetical protein
MPCDRISGLEIGGFEATRVLAIRPAFVTGVVTRYNDPV